MYRIYLMTTDERYIQMNVIETKHSVYRHYLEGTLQNFYSAVVVNKILIYKDEKLLRVCHIIDKYFRPGDSFTFFFKII